ncbi:MAG: acyl carrier protein [Thermoguttaceae bacterium]|jgi:acyl carrier protein|nr:acyl carrier protein [Thermoguttaceae bacterium]
MTSAELRETIIDILSEIAPDEDYESLKDDVSFRDQLGMDSMDMLDVVLGLRRRYKLPIPEDDYPKLDSMNSTIEYLLPLVNEKKD